MKKDLLLPFQQSMAGAPAGKHLLTVSGGVDSMVLAQLYLQAKLPFAIAHCNFQLRGQDSDDDQILVRQWAQKHQIPFFTQNFTTQAYREDSRLSTQMAARELRYQWFEAIARVWGFTAIVTAHHLDDQLETFLMQLGRGNGLEGLRGIPHKAGLRWRPLLGITKDQIRAYAETHQIPWREDASNRTDDYKRNALRHQVIPQLKATDPQFLSSFQQSLSYLEEVYTHIAQQAEEFKQKNFRPTSQGYRIAKSTLLPSAISPPLIHQLFFAYGFKGPEVENLVQASSGKFLENPQATLYSEREDLYLELTPSEVSTIRLNTWEDLSALQTPIQLLETPTKMPKQIPQTHAYLEKEMLKFPLRLRPWQKGDYFYPTGMSGRKLVSKFYKDLKLNSSQKQTQLILVSQNQVVWIVGRRCDRRFAAHANTTSITALKTSEL